MNKQPLSKRLAAVAKHIPYGSTFADIGSDHAYLPIYMIATGRAKKVIAGEVNDGPWQSAKNQVEQSGWEKAIQVRKGDGLDVIQPYEADTITIAGMGATLIKNILHRGSSRLAGVQKLILQPNVSAFILRQWLVDNDWELKAEEIVEEDGRNYEVLISERGDPLAPYAVPATWHYEQQILMGPFLLEEQQDAFIHKWEQEWTQRHHIYQSLQRSQTEMARQKQAQIQKEMQMIEEGLKK